MEYFTSSLRKTCFLILSVLALNAAAEKVSIRAIQFAPEFLEELRQNNIDQFDFKIQFFNTPEEAVFPESWQRTPYGHYREGQKSYNLQNKNFLNSIEVGDTIKAYYIFYSDHVILEKGYTEMPRKDLNRSTSIEINPLTQCKKVMLKSSIGTDGQPISTSFLFNPYLTGSYHILRLRPEYLSGIVLEHQEGTDSPMDQSAPKEPKTTAFWAEPGLEMPYIIYSGSNYLIKEGYYKIDNTEVPDTIALDYRQAKKVLVSVKDVNGAQMDLRKLAGKDSTFNRLFFQTRAATGPTAYSYNCKTISADYSIPKVSFDEPIHSFELYAFPGDYILEFWSQHAFEDADNNLCPRGLQGIIQINEEKVQHVDFDFSRYLTLIINNNAEPNFHGADYWFRTSRPTEKFNKLLNEYHYPGRPGTTTAYTKVLPLAPGKFMAKIWPPMGYETADIEGMVYDYPCSWKDVDLKQLPSKTFDVPHMCQVHCVIPAFLRNLYSYLHFGEMEYHLGQEPDRHDPVYYPNGIFEQKDTVSYYKLAGNYDIFFNIEKPHYQERQVYKSDVRHVTVNDAEELYVDLFWNRAVIIENTESYFYDYPQDAGAFLLESTTPTAEEDFSESLDLFTKTGGIPFNLCGRFTLPQQKVLRVTDSLTRARFHIEGYSEFLLASDKRGDVYIDTLQWTGNDGQTAILGYDIRLNHKDSARIRANIGLLDFTVYSGIQSDNNSKIVYPYHVDWNTIEELILPGKVSSATFYRGEEYVPLYGKITNDSIYGEVKLYYLDCPYVNAEKPLEVFLSLKDRQNRQRSRIKLYPGSYCAVDGQGTKSYFVIPRDTRVGIKVDFNNPTTGIQKVATEGKMPTIYYDLSGRRLLAPQKGVNLIRMPNGKVKKVMIK